MSPERDADSIEPELDADNAAERRTLKWVLGINTTQVVVAGAVGLVAQSAGRRAQGGRGRPGRRTVMRERWTSMGRRVFGHRWQWLALAVGVMLADQAAKRQVVASLPYGASEPLTPFFNLVHVLNPGAAFSFLSGAGGWQRYLFIALALAVSAFLIFLLLRQTLSRLEAGGYSLVLGGALGNASDRFLHGAVVDYLDFHLAGWHWPAFNLADSAIVLGVLLLLYGSAKFQPKASCQRVASEPGPPASGRGR